MSSLMVCHCRGTQEGVFPLRKTSDKTGQSVDVSNLDIKVKGKVHPCTGTEVPYRPYGP